MLAGGTETGMEQGPQAAASPGDKTQQAGPASESTQGPRLGLTLNVYR